MTDQENKAIKEELDAIKAQMSALLRSSQSKLESPGVEETAASSSKDKEDSTNEQFCVSDVDDKSHQARTKTKSEEKGEMSLNALTKTPEQMETMMKTMSTKLEKVETFCMISKANIDALEANFKSSEANNKLLEYRLKVTEEKVCHLQEALNTKNLENESTVTLLKSTECQVESNRPTRDSMQKEMASLELKFENLQMKVDEELGQLKSDIKQLHEEAEKSNSMIKSQFKAVYKCISMTSKERKEGIFF